MTFVFFSVDAIFMAMQRFSTLCKNDVWCPFFDDTESQSRANDLSRELRMVAVPALPYVALTHTF